MRPTREATETEFWLKARAYWLEAADRWATWDDTSGFNRAMARVAAAEENYHSARAVSDCGCLAGACNFRF